MTSPWTIDLSFDGHAGVISPGLGTGAPFRVQVSHPNGAVSVSTHLATMERAVETLCTFIMCQGSQVPIETRAEWVVLAHKYDEPTDRYVQ